MRLAGRVVGAMTAEKAQLNQSEGSPGTGDLEKRGRLPVIAGLRLEKWARMSPSRQPSNEVGGYGKLNGRGWP